MSYTRRRLLAVAAAGGAGLSGCLSNQDPGDGNGGGAGFTAEASFSVIYDFARNVVPDGAEANNLVPFGQHGHGWSPSPDVQRSVMSADAFVYVLEDFQPWADDMVANIEQDSPETETIEAGEDVDLLGADYSHDEEGGHEEHDEGDEGSHGEEHEDGHNNDEGHDHGGTNPHFWLDPLRAKTAVRTIADGLAEAHGEDGYTENADEYASRLDELDTEFESSLGDGSKDAVLVAGHDAFAYLGERYGFRVETLTGVSPDEEPSPDDIQRAQELIDDEGIEYVLSPVFESDTAAQSLVEDTTADEVLPITAFAGFSEEWLENDWGYIEVMENVNLSSLERALDA
ncbi:MAG: metal ABC transporter substrate-binding protein [Halobacteriales archaeon]